MKQSKDQTTAAKPKEDGASAVVIEKVFDFVKWIMSKVENFPRSYKFTLGNRIVENSLDLLSSLVEAAYSHEKVTDLVRAGRKANLLRYLFRLSKEKNIISFKSYQFSAAQLFEIGRMIGGWLRYCEK